MPALRGVQHQAKRAIVRLNDLAMDQAPRPPLRSVLTRRRSPRVARKRADRSGWRRPTAALAVLHPRCPRERIAPAPWHQAISTGSGRAVRSVRLSQTIWPALEFVWNKVIIPLATPAVVGVGAYAALRQVEIARRRHDAQTQADRQRRLTESYSKAVEQLASDKVEVRLGGFMRSNGFLRKAWTTIGR